jgi:hypothetical protein
MIDCHSTICIIPERKDITLVTINRFQANHAMFFLLETSLIQGFQKRVIKLIYNEISVLCRSYFQHFLKYIFLSLTMNSWEKGQY